MTVQYSAVQYSTVQQQDAGLASGHSRVAGLALHTASLGINILHYTTLHYTIHYTTLRNVNTVIRTGAGAGAGDLVLINTPHVVSSEDSDSDNTSQSR